ncbi:class I SAM-dependent methyltransferase [Selenomonas sp.]|uniref:tRNA (mnm(5)s(2)U34)-methyltransferase n=1 Tax=Selenomonas sp. TaxID=2053611 RepID=UPI0025D2AC96|nr:class I SAM-dependent methyltransferase [Selenomonas sp.]MBQ1867622.1 methyltransferase domain-containing protein [Selenomonas sp.]
MQTVSNVINLMHQSILPAVRQAEVIVDATAGNGGDTLFLAQNMKESCHLYAFDIQAEAIEHTKQRTSEFAGKITYLQQSHEQIDRYVDRSIDVAMFNLGYLPGAAHDAVTKHETTLKAVKCVLAKLSLQGICAIMVYPGHPEGKVEADCLANFLQALPVRDYTVGCYRLWNHRPEAPYGFILERTR